MTTFSSQVLSGSCENIHNNSHDFFFSLEMLSMTHLVFCKPGTNVNPISFQIDISVNSLLAYSSHSPFLDHCWSVVPRLITAKKQFYHSLLRGNVSNFRLLALEVSEKWTEMQLLRDTPTTLPNFT